MKTASVRVKTILSIIGLSMVMWPTLICSGELFSKEQNMSDNLSFGLLKRIPELSGIDGSGSFLFFILLIVGFIIIKKSVKRTPVPENEDYSDIKE
jgi:hypothetical protein